MKKALTAMMILTACSGVSAHDASIILTEEPDAPVRVSIEVEEPTITVIEEEEIPEPVIVSLPVLPQQVQSAVQQAPSFYNEYFSELRSDRRRASRIFSRREPEEFNLRHDHELHELVVLVLSRLCVSEANWAHDERFDHDHPEANHAELDCPAIYQVLRRTRRDGETMMGVLRRHTHYVTEQWAPPRMRMRWIVELQLAGHRPASFPSTDRNGNPISWEHDYLPRWQAMQALVRQLLAGEGRGPCFNAPLVTWGGRCDDVGGACDDHIAEGRGLIPYDCGETANRFWCRPGEPGCAAAVEVAEAEVPGI